MSDEINPDRRDFLALCSDSAAWLALRHSQPSLGSVTGWLNSQPLTAAGLWGKVVSPGVEAFAFTFGQLDGRPAMRLVLPCRPRRFQGDNEIAMRIVKAAGGVPLSPVLYNREGRVEKVVRKIQELGQQGVQFATFLETVVPIEGDTL